MRRSPLTVSQKIRSVRARHGLCDAMAALALVWTCSACGGGVTLVRDTPTGGLVTYPFQHEVDILTSTERRDAMELINRKCPDGSRVQKEGEMPKVSRAADRAWRGQMGGERLWGIQFTCEAIP
ncbi:MAG: hypothetical protein JSR64_08870 [Nitrospira sp.]|nr:hypothetical protein [Nitrospira sp.]MBS0174136.1 hypothetical protein [Nitrospira sp.]MBX3336295.1 hypothetical protein [Nitrospira sp.]MCW5780722.1 hypothetical protein [Nitrospira sp.]HNL89264.1 hypothetical protein [Nitrospira sp.]